MKKRDEQDRWNHRTTFADSVMNLSNVLLVVGILLGQFIPLLYLAGFALWGVALAIRVWRDISARKVHWLTVVHGLLFAFIAWKTVQSVILMV